ncbi:hypothetical protein GCM10009675_02910 [Prauserella alba]|uniref:Uncharacterized protein n=1 Tax=Prauserella alba TaxID=176898 RepID=A0ABP4FQG1_9PSEU
MPWAKAMSASLCSADARMPGSDVAGFGVPDSDVAGSDVVETAGVEVGVPPEVS